MVYFQGGAEGVGEAAMPFSFTHSLNKKSTDFGKKFFPFSKDSILIELRPPGKQIG